MNRQQRQDLRAAIEMRGFWLRAHGDEMAWHRCAEIFTDQRQHSKAVRALVESWRLADFDPWAPLDDPNEPMPPNASEDYQYIGEDY